MIDDADGFLGALLAIEGITDARAVINGPNGCRGYPAYLSDRLYPREYSLSRRYFEELFFFGQSRIPCTYLDADDYITGSTEKLQKILPLIAEKGDTLIALINSPGASLIGDDLNRFIRQAGMDHKCLAFEDAWYSEPVSVGNDETVLALLKWLRLHPLPKVKKRVNLLGLSLYQRYWEGNAEELVHLCELMGLHVISRWTGSTVAEIRESTAASHNLVIFPEFASKTAVWYEQKYGIPAVLSPGGAPIGFDATEQWIQSVATALKVDPAPALDHIHCQKECAFHIIGRVSHEASFIKGLSFGIRAPVSWALPLVTWLYTYLNMFPVSVQLFPGGDPIQRQQLTDLLMILQETSILGVDPKTVQPDFFFSEGIFGKHLLAEGTCKSYLDLSNRMYTEIDFTRKTLLGGSGALFLLEYIFRETYNSQYLE
ncbi:MAG: hypothetical protein LUQ50_08840 [Methanospirillum sp.]|uniref:nitrogenase component 1 n=1 Tax=Methanospirillum sp. TaxID=45200 RepID=UPI0023747AC1|nr:nitrogenase component 1 [Methanospirillum sp.]MDD1729164.1 hypothetical protein [Methanospirillum sp.]